jgi:hypothetical protein
VVAIELTRVVQEYSIPFLRLRNHLLVGIDDVLVRRHGMLSIIKKNDNVLVLESMHSLDVALHIEDIIPAPTQFTWAVAFEGRNGSNN